LNKLGPGVQGDRGEEVYDGLTTVRKKLSVTGEREKRSKKGTLNERHVVLVNRQCVFVACGTVRGEMVKGGKKRGVGGNQSTGKEK